MRILAFILVLMMFVSSIVLAQETISPNEPIQGSLSENQLTAEYTFKGVAGSTVTITLSSRRFDAYLTLQDSNGTEVGSNDDFGGSLDSNLSTILPDDDTYTIVVGSADGSGTGNYELTLSYIRVETIEYGEVVEGEITEATPRVQYQFEGQAGDNVLISLTSSSFDTFLHLADSSNFDLITDDDGGDGTNSLIAGYELPQTGTYFITVRPYSELATGEYTLQIHPIEVTPLAANSTVEGEINGDTHIYAVEVAAGDRLEFDVSSADGLDTTLLLRGANGFTVVTDDDSGDDLNPEIHNWLIEEYGTFSIIVQSVDSSASGSYELTYTVYEPEPLTCDATQTLDFTTKNQTLVFSIQPKADEELTFVFTSEEADASSLYIRAFQDGVIVPFDSNEIAESGVRQVFTSENNAAIRLLVSDYNYRVETFTLELSCQ